MTLFSCSLFSKKRENHTYFREFWRRLWNLFDNCNILYALESKYPWITISCFIFVMALHKSRERTSSVAILELFGQINVNSNNSDMRVFSKAPTQMLVFWMLFYSIIKISRYVFLPSWEVCFLSTGCETFYYWEQTGGVFRISRNDGTFCKS